MPFVDTRLIHTRFLPEQRRGSVNPPRHSKGRRLTPLRPGCPLEQLQPSVPALAKAK